MKGAIMELSPEVSAERAEIRDHIKFENDLIHQRMTWSGTFEGLLLAVVSFAWDKSDAKPLLIVICLVAIAVTVSFGYAIHRANMATARAAARWDAIGPARYRGLDVEGFRSEARPFGWLMPGRFVPLLLTVTWIVILVLVIRKTAHN
jgi:hypothetical protein